MPLPSERIEEIISVFNKAKIRYDEEVREILFADVHFLFVSRLRNYKADALRLRGDLNLLNSIERLIDGSVPFAIWLRNAVNTFADVDTTHVFSRSIDELNTKVTNVAPIVNAASVPAVAVKEAIVQQNDMVAFGFLVGGSSAGAAVARLEVPRHQNTIPFLNADDEPEVHQGTGWLITPELLMTNHHVINARNDGEADASLADLEVQGQKTIVQFDVDGQTSTGAVTSAAKLEAFDPALDFAVLRLSAPVARTPLRLHPDKIEIKSDSYIAVNIIQHPYGGPKKVALRNNLVYDSTFPRLRYFTDTDHGSSGSPVFNDKWEVVALHRASTFVENVRFQGRPAGWVNEGTHILAILEHIKQNNPSLHQEITGKT
jgi:hypothetical protein